MTDLRQAAQEALDAWDNPTGMKRLCVAMDSIRTALEQQQQAEPVQEPCKACRGTGEVETGIGMLVCSECHGITYTTPPAAQRKPLTATTILNMMPGSIPAEYDGSLMNFARYIEQAHNIKEGT